MPLHIAGCHIAVTMVASNTYTAITVGQVEAGLVPENTTLCHSASQRLCSRAHCSLRCLWFLDNGSRRNGMRASSPARSRLRRTVDADRSTPVAVLQCRANFVDDPVRSVTDKMAVYPVQWSHCVVQYPLVAANDPLLSTGATHASLSKTWARNRDGGRGGGGTAARVLTTKATQGSITDGASPGFSPVEDVPNDAVSRGVFSGSPTFPRHCIPALLHCHLASPSSAVKTPTLRAARKFFTCNLRRTCYSRGLHELGGENHPYRLFTGWEGGGGSGRLLAFYQGELDSILSGVAPRFSQVRIVPYDAAGPAHFWGISRFPRPLHSGAAPHLFSPSSALESSTHLHSSSVETYIKMDPGSELGSFDLGSGKMLVKPGIRLPDHVLQAAHLEGARHLTRWR
ncbi:hypothetical protein PR048_031254 [Dryococelus australis]|uniref:Uncharacterized protein n=1 Tax=Dryococelus australis TaxID=614101 RepID=A0ABQ9G5W0_9NEOP|nr:hypothetical protein PR048_031254 [Dryococelus australis]